MQKIAGNTHAIELQQVCAGGLIGISLVFIQNFGGTGGATDTSSQIATIAFALALPFLGGILLLAVVQKKYRYGTPGSLLAKVTHGSYLFGLMCATVGVGAALWHISRIAGVVFFVALLIAFAIYIFNILDLEEVLRDDEQRERASYSSLASQDSKKESIS